MSSVLALKCTIISVLFFQNLRTSESDENVKQYAAFAFLTAFAFRTISFGASANTNFGALTLKITKLGATR